MSYHEFNCISRMVNDVDQLLVHLGAMKPTSSLVKWGGFCSFSFSFFTLKKIRWLVFILLSYDNFLHGPGTKSFVG